MGRVLLVLPYTHPDDLDQTVLWLRLVARRQEDRGEILNKQGSGCLITLLFGVVLWGLVALAGLGGCGFVAALAGMPPVLEAAC